MDVWFTQTRAQPEPIPVEQEVLTTRGNKNCGLALTFAPAGTPIDMRVTTDVTPILEQDRAAKVTCCGFHSLKTDMETGFPCASVVAMN